MPTDLTPRIQQLMIDVGLPDSRSLYQAFKQLEMEVRLDERERRRIDAPPSPAAPGLPTSRVLDPPAD